MSDSRFTVLDCQKEKKPVYLPLTAGAAGVGVALLANAEAANAQATVSADIDQMSADVTAIGAMVDTIRPIAITVVLVALALMFLKRLGYA